MSDVAIRSGIRYDGRQEAVLPALRQSRLAAHVFAVVLVVAVAGWFAGGRTLIGSLRTRIAIGRLAETAPQRLPIARFSALRPLGKGRAHVERGVEDDLPFKASLASVQVVAPCASDAEGRAASAAAFVIAREWHSAIEGLERAVVDHPDDASLWSDLSAARFERGLNLVDAETLLEALVAADRSLEIDPLHSNALFNRALILDRLGLRTEAKKAWEACIREANNPMIAAEADRRRAQLLSPVWKDVKTDLLAAAKRGDEGFVENLVARFPQDARAYCELDYLTSWANAFQANDDRTSAQYLWIARTTGSALQRSGESMLSDAVRAIDVADAADRRRIALAQQAYDAGRTAYEDGHYSEAEKLFGSAALQYAEAGSPMRSVARAYVAFVLLDEQRVQEAFEALTTIAAEVRAKPGHRALLALVQWVLGRCEAFRAHWNESVAALLESRSLFQEMGETKNLGAIDSLLSEVYEYLGRSDLAWPHCASAFRGLSEEGNVFRLQVGVAAGVRIAMQMRRWDVAASLLTVELSVASDLRKPALTAETLRRRFIVENQRHHRSAAEVALARARIAAASAGDESPRQTAELDQAEAVVTLRNDPRRALALLNRSLDFATRTDQRLFIAELLRKRGTAHLVLNETRAARDDFAAGVAELERQRGAIEAPELRATFFDTWEGLFDQALLLNARTGDAAAAFRFADAARGRTLLDRIQPDRASSQRPIADRLRDAALVEYAVTEQELVVFCIRRSGLSMHRIPISAALLRQKIDFANASPDTATDLEGILFDAIRSDIASAGMLLIVPDDELQHVPFAALRNLATGKYLGQSYAIAIAPSAAVLGERSVVIQNRRSALLVGNASGDEATALPYLPNVDEEITALRRNYAASHVLFGLDATRARFIAEAPNYDVIHFSGHGVSDAESLTASLLFAKSGSDSGRMYMSDIAKLRLPRAPLVVLAACGTLRGRAAGVEGMPSLARSFLAAGASTVVGTLWDIDDAKAAPLLESFHRHIVEGDSPANALRSAQLEAIARGGEDAKPVNWAPFVVYTATP